MALLTLLWGFQQVTIKIIAGEVSLLMQAALRSIVATLLLLAWARWRGIALYERDDGGLGYTNASRMVVFVYLTPPLTALGLHFFVRGERLVPGQWAGVLLAFAGVILAFADGFVSAGNTFVGDLCGVIAAILWSATTVVIRATRLARAPATKTTFYQLGVSAASSS